MIRTSGRRRSARRRRAAARALEACGAKYIALELNAETVREARDATQTSERKLTVPRRTLGELQALADLKLERVSIEPGSAGVGKSVVELELRRATGALMIAVQRGVSLVEQPDPKEPFQAGDIVFLAGSGEAIRKAVALLT